MATEAQRTQRTEEKDPTSLDVFSVLTVALWPFVSFCKDFQV
jgi:hypothetical protein